MNTAEAKVDERKKAAKAKLSRRSAAYHRAYKQAIQDGCEQHIAREKAKKATCQHYSIVLLSIPARLT